jgi:hypothetical protein
MMYAIDMTPILATTFLFLPPALDSSATSSSSVYRITCFACLLYVTNPNPSLHRLLSLFGEKEC